MSQCISVCDVSYAAKVLKDFQSTSKHCQLLAAFVLQVIPSAWLRLFNPKEINELLSGGEGGGVDAADMRQHATYSGGYSADSQTIKLFWKVRT